MSLPKQVEYISVEDYLEGEKVSDVKHEYIAGQVYAMAGTSRAHNQIAINLAAGLRARLRGSQCRAFFLELKARIESADTFYYPDVMVTCRGDDSARYYITHPNLIVEILSPSTEMIDRREKMLTYRQLESLREYVLIAQDKRQIEVYRREESGRWHHEILGPENSLVLESLPIGPLELTMDEVYEDVDFYRDDQE